MNVYGNRRYLVVEGGTSKVLGDFWTSDYEHAQTRAAELNGVVTTHRWLLRQTGRDFPAEMGEKKQEGPKHLGGPAKTPAKGRKSRSKKVVSA